MTVRERIVDRLTLAMGGALGGVCIGPAILPLSPDFDGILTLLPVYAVAGAWLAVHFLKRA